ncbi:HNH endonuclease domain-containing protein [Flavobacterium luteolum]|uniref:HNH endonuclease domain-containing protein n=1 Tax=Flavobacterium luteolum TaxID=3003259 RepID=UPI00248E1CAD|nr:HNH endonuclease domain-containing protein [Flavobacterium luteolum]
MNLPFFQDLPIPKLASAFGNTSATYKFYWLLSIIEMVEEGQLEPSKRALFARMIGNSWYTVNYFRVSFGKQDLIQQAVHSLAEWEGLAIDIKKDLLINILEVSTLKSTQQTLQHFNKNVPHWFLSPWFRKNKEGNDVAYRKHIYASSQKYENKCLYALYDNHIVINPIWTDYLRSNAKVLKDFIYWNLTLFLQVRNPNVPDIANKLIRPPLRSSLHNQRKNYWDNVFKELGTVHCIFTGKTLTISQYALDHFVPHAFVSHDLIWNLVPIDIHFNSTKSDKLPIMEMHFDSFFKLQKIAFEIMRRHSPRSKLIEEYLSIFPDLNDMQGFDYTRYKESIQPLVTIAHNNGFGYLPIDRQ